MDLTSDNSQIEAAEVAPDSVTTAVTETADIGEQTDQEDNEPKTFTQEELSRIVAKETAKVERKLRREADERANAPRPMVEPNLNDFTSQAAYIDAAAAYKAEQIVATREAQKQQKVVAESYADREEVAREKYSDYAEAVHVDTKDGGPAISREMATVIMDSEIGPEIAYYLAKNVDESKRIWALSPLAQAAAIGKIEAKLTAKGPAKPSSNAPNPIKPIGSGRSTNPARDTQDPRSMKSMTDAEWINAENARRRKLAQNK